MSGNLRNERQNGIRSGRVKRYLLYAVGEIVLVVIGILIAIQINYWTEEAKQRKDEFFILTEIQQNLNRDGRQIAGALRQRTKTQAAILRMATYLPVPAAIREDTFSYDLAQLFTFERFFPIRTSYEIAKVNGLPISNKQLRSDIANYYEYEQNMAQMSLRDIEASFMSRLPSIHSDHYFIDRYGESVVLTDFRNPAFLKSIGDVLSYYIPNNTGTLAKLREFQAVNAAMQDAIAEELVLFK